MFRWNVLRYAKDTQYAHLVIFSLRWLLPGWGLTSWGSSSGGLMFVPHTKRASCTVRRINNGKTWFWHDSLLCVAPPAERRRHHSQRHFIHCQRPLQDYLSLLLLLSLLLFLSFYLSVYLSVSVITKTCSAILLVDRERSSRNPWMLRAYN